MLEFNAELASTILREKAEETLKQLQERLEKNKESYIKDFDSLPDFIQDVVKSQVDSDPTFCLTNLGAFLFSAKDAVQLADQFSSLREFGEIISNPQLLKEKKFSQQHSQETFQLMCAFVEEILKRKPNLIVTTEMPSVPNLRLLK